MMSESESLPGNPLFWEKLNRRANEMLEGSMCARVHPVMEKWLEGIYESKLEFDRLTKKALSNAYTATMVWFPFLTEENRYEKIIKVLLLSGMDVANTAAVDLDTLLYQRPEIGQALACLTREISNTTFEDELVQRRKPLRVAALAESFKGKKKDKQFIGIMLLGWKFLKSIEQGELDDL